MVLSWQSFKEKLAFVQHVQVNRLRRVYHIYRYSYISADSKTSATLCAIPFSRAQSASHGHRPFPFPFFTNAVAHISKKKKKQVPR